MIITSFMSTFFMFLGYWIYIRKSLSEEIKPNPTTWLMFTYGTTLLTVLEWDRGGSWLVLAPPAVCSLMSLYVGLICVRRGTMRWPKKIGDKIPFMLDMFLTVLYLTSWVAMLFSFLEESQRSVAALGFLLGSNATSVTSFLPILIGTWKKPREENWVPWTIWTGSYALLLISTIHEVGVDGGNYDLLIYPVFAAVLHGLVAIFSIRKKKNRKKNTKGKSNDFNNSIHIYSS